MTLGGALARKLSSVSWRSRLAMFLSSCSSSLASRLRLRLFLRFGHFEHQVDLGGGSHHGRFGSGFRLVFELHVGHFLDGAGVALRHVQRVRAGVHRARKLLLGVELALRAQRARHGDDLLQDADFALGGDGRSLRAGIADIAPARWKQAEPFARSAAGTKRCHSSSVRNGMAGCSRRSAVLERRQDIAPSGGCGRSFPGIAASSAPGTNRRIRARRTATAPARLRDSDRSRWRGSPAARNRSGG